MADLIPLVTINSNRFGKVNLPSPSTYEGNTATIVDSSRNADGYIRGSVIRDDVGKISMTWKFISAQQWADMLQLFSLKKGGSFTNRVTFFCQDSNSWETREMYVSDRNASIFLRNNDGSIKGYKDAKLNLIEV